MNLSYEKPYHMNIEGREMETYKLFIVPIGNAEITEEIEFHSRPPVLKY